VRDAVLAIGTAGRFRVAQGEDVGQHRDHFAGAVTVRISQFLAQDAECYEYCFPALPALFPRGPN
jgi:hypothetical protein